MAYVITSPCVGEKAGDCVEVCPVDCIIEGEDQFYIDPDSCLDCGACEVVCPVSAIYYEEDIPEEERWFIEKAKRFFQRTVE
ncbi:MAG: 4Fe-4S binding protein [Caldibacillus sp.]